MSLDTNYYLRLFDFDKFYQHQSYFDNDDKIAEIHGCFIMALEFSKRICQEIKRNHGNREFFHKMIKQRLESAELILKTDEKNIPHDEYVTLKKMLENQWKSYHTWKIVFQKLDSKKDIDE